MDITDRWYPERFFYSHATLDDRLTATVKKVLQSGNGNYELYAAERGLVGKPLMHKLREELLDCNAILVGWTSNTNKKSTSQIISFELGMAFSLGLPVYLIKCGKTNMPWFFDKLTDYAEISAPTEANVEEAISKIEPYTFYHPIDLTCPLDLYLKGPLNKPASLNMQVVKPDGTIVLPAEFDGVLHFKVTSRRPRPERDVRLILQFPPQVKVTFDPGSHNSEAAVQRNDMFYMWPRSAGVEIYWPSFAPRDFIFELHLETFKGQPRYSGSLECRLSSENVIDWRSKSIPLCIG